MVVNMMKKVLYLIVPNNMFIYMLDNRPTNLTVVHLRKKKKKHRKYYLNRYIKVHKLHCQKN